MGRGEDGIDKLNLESEGREREVKGRAERGGERGRERGQREE